MFFLFVVGAVQIVSNYADITLFEESVVGFRTIAVIVKEFTYHHIKLLAFFDRRVGFLS